MTIPLLLKNSATTLGALLTCLALSSAAQAIQPTLVEIKPESDGTVTHIYKIKIDETVRVEGGTSTPNPDFFTVFNFQGYVAGSAQQPAGWAFSTSENGVTPYRGGRTVLAPLDLPGIPNLTWSRTGPTLIGPLEVKGFSVRTKVKNTQIGEYGSQVTRIQPGTLDAKTVAESKEARIGSITTPVVVHAVRPRELSPN